MDKFLLTPMGVLTHGSAYARLSAQPPISANVYRVASKYLPQPIKIDMQSLRTLRKLLLGYFPSVLPKSAFRGGGGGGGGVVGGPKCFSLLEF